MIEEGIVQPRRIAMHMDLKIDQRINLTFIHNYLIPILVSVMFYFLLGIFGRYFLLYRHGMKIPISNLLNLFIKGVDSKDYVLSMLFLDTVKKKLEISLNSYEINEIYNTIYTRSLKKKDNLEIIDAFCKLKLLKTTTDIKTVEELYENGTNLEKFCDEKLNEIGIKNQNF